MKTPYTIEELDSLIGACINFSDHTGEVQFYQGNIAGRKDVRPDPDHVKRIMEWVAEVDRGILEGMGFGTDHIYYYRLGPHARQLMQEGGFRKYFRKKQQRKAVEGWLHWSPIVIALFALLISAAAWLFPREGSERIEELGLQMEELRVEQSDLKAAFQALKDAEQADTVAVQKQRAR